MPFSRQLEKIKQGKLWRFFGGIRPSDRKATTNSPIEELAIPSLITLPLDRHLGTGGQILVKVGDYVKAGQPLTIPGGKRNVPLHASTSGHITGIGMQLLPHPSGYLGRCITIKPDGLDTPVLPQPMLDWQEKTPHELLERIRFYGVEGLGGAQFQTAAKIGAALEESSGECNIFIVNGAECEPVATCDDRLMQERAQDIAQGIEVVRKILQPKAIIVAIEDNKPKALEAMQAAVAEDVMVRKIPTLYPSGAARNLIKICTGIEIPYSAHTSECGIVVDNVETVFAIKQAVIDGLPLIKRVVTVDGMTLGRTGNALVRLGTSVRFVLNAYKLNPEHKQRVILGGPFMGFTLPSIDVPITKSTTCVFVPSVKEVEFQPEEMNCIRCGRCARVCPSRLVPYQLYSLSKAGEHKRTKSCGMMDCTECGCCAYVCPSKIALTNQFRKEKAIIRIMDDNQRRSIRAKERMAARTERLQKEELARQKRRAAALSRMQENQDASPEELQARREQALAQARQRAAAKRAQLGLTQVSSVGNNQEQQLDDKTNLTQASVLGYPYEATTTEPNKDTQAQGQSTPEEKVEQLPSSLRKSAQPKHAEPLRHWEAAPEQPQDLTPVENPPAQGEEIPVSKPRAKSYLYNDANTPVQLDLPKSLARKDIDEVLKKRAEEARIAAEEAAKAAQAEAEAAAKKAAEQAQLEAKLQAEAEQKAREREATLQAKLHGNVTTNVSLEKLEEQVASVKSEASPMASSIFKTQRPSYTPPKPRRSVPLWTAGELPEEEIVPMPDELAKMDTTKSEQDVNAHKSELHKVKFTYGNKALENEPLPTRRIQATVAGTKVNITLAHAATMEEAEYLANMHPALNDQNNGVATLAAPQDQEQAMQEQSGQDKTSDHKPIKQQRYGDWVLPEQPSKRWVAPGSDDEQ